MVFTEKKNISETWQYIIITENTIAVSMNAGCQLVTSYVPEYGCRPLSWKKKKKRYFLILIGYSLKKIQGNQWTSWDTRHNANHQLN